MTLHEIWALSPQAFTFIVERDNHLAVTSKQEYRGTGPKGNCEVTRITPPIYPMHGPVLEVEIKEPQK